MFSPGPSRLHPMNAEITTQSDHFGTELLIYLESFTFSYLLKAVLDYKIH